MGNFRALALALILVPAVAAAQSAKDKQRASDLVKQAIAKSQGGDHEKAVELYEAAYKIIPQPLLLSNIGSEYQQLDKPVEALKYFCKYIEADPNGSNMSFAQAQARILYVKLGGAENVKDEDLCKPIGKPSTTDPVLTSADATSDSTSAPGLTPTDTTPQAKASPIRWVGVGVGVLGLGVFGLGTYYGMQAKDISDRITNHDPSTPWPADINQLEADGESYEKKQIAFMIGGGAAVAAGVVMFFLGAPKATAESGASVTFAPVATPDSVGFAAAGRF